MTRIMCVRLVQWPLDRQYRRKPELRREPVALVHTSGQRQDVVAACGRAARFGIAPGITLAAARALCHGLAVVEAEPEQDHRALLALGRWLTRFAPSVSPQPPDGLFLDITGCERLYHGLAALVKQVDEAMASRLIAVSIVVAPTPGAAWAIATDRRNHRRVIDEAALHDALMPLPPAALRIDPVACERLAQLGIATIRQLIALPRRSLPARLGDDVLHRIDQAFGRTPEPLSPLAHFTPIRIRARLDEPIFSPESVHYALKELLSRAALEMTRRGVGARVITIDLRPPYGNENLSRRIPLARPTRDMKRLMTLIECAITQGGGREGFTRFELAVPVFEPLPHEQLGLGTDIEQHTARAFDDLTERLAARLGDAVLTRPAPVQSYLPERAFQRIGVTVDAMKRIQPVDRLPPRPSRLLRQPLLIHVTVSPSPDGEPVAFRHGTDYHRLAHIRGPERIGGEWWRGHLRERDYFDVETDLGRRFWIFRVNPTRLWYLHGVFE